MRVAVVGGGIAGLVAARELAGGGAAVTVFERAPRLGGQAGSFELAPGVHVERYYHFICKGDTGYLRMLDELQLSEQLRWRTTDMGLFYDGTLHTFGDPLSLLRFPHLSVRDKIRFARTTAAARLRPATRWHDIEHLTAAAWLTEHYGERAYRLLYEPLLASKFQDHASRVSAAWMWARLNRLGNSRSRLLKERVGYLEGGSQAYVDALERALRERNVDVRVGAHVDRVTVEGGRTSGLIVDGVLDPYDAVLSTVPVPHTAGLFQDLEGPYFENLRALEYLGVMVMTLHLDRPFSRYYWTNVSDPRLPMSGVIEATNLNPLPALRGGAVLYIPQYLAHTDERYARSADQVLAQYCAALQLMNPDFDRSWIKGYWLHREQFTQPVCDVGFSTRVPGIRTPVPNLYLTDSYQLNPNDRAISFSTDLGREAAELILEDR